MRLFVFVLLSWVIALPVLAREGLLEINQSCALAPTGCFSGDFVGFPVTIDGSAGKSYVLTGNLQVPDVNTRGIEIRTSHVTVDLRGFEIRGDTTCSGTPLACAPLGSSEGVAVANTFFHRNVTVMNGTVIGMGNHGIVVGQSGVVEKVNSSQNGNIGIFGDRGSILRDNVTSLNGVNGIHVAFNGTVTGNSSSQNALVGIFAGVGSTITGNTAYLNGGDGVFGGDGSAVIGNATYQNGADGITTSNGTLISGNTAYRNGNDGIQGNSGVTIVDNSCFDNGDAVDPTNDDGIECAVGCTVRGNTARDNGGVGIRLGTDSAYRENVVTNNMTNGIVGAGAANNLGDNYCLGAGVAGAFCP